MPHKTTQTPYKTSPSEGLQSLIALFLVSIVMFISGCHRPSSIFPVPNQPVLFSLVVGFHYHGIFQEFNLRDIWGLTIFNVFFMLPCTVHAFGRMSLEISLSKLDASVHLASLLKQWMGIHINLDVLCPGYIHRTLMTPAHPRNLEIYLH